MFCEWQWPASVPAGGGERGTRSVARFASHIYPAVTRHIIEEVFTPPLCIFCRLILLNFYDNCERVFETIIECVGLRAAAAPRALNARSAHCLCLAKFDLVCGDSITARCFCCPYWFLSNPLKSDRLKKSFALQLSREQSIGDSLWFFWRQYFLNCFVPTRIK